jgi:hypothetical protein
MGVLWLFHDITDPAIYILTYNKNSSMIGEWKSKTAGKGIQKIIIDKYPDQLKLDFALWTREAVKLVIRQTYRIEMSIRSTGEYLKQWQYTP